MYIKNKLDQLNFKEITPIQAGVFKHFKHQKHLVGLAPTGTGKTHAYLLPILENITFQKNEVQALIIVPTNELVIQVETMLKAVEDRVVVRSYYGGSNKQKEQAWLEKNQPDIVITTPERLKAYVVDLNILKIQTTKYFVLDEADMMFDYEFLSLIDQILPAMPKAKYLLFSATIHQSMEPFIKKYFGVYDLIDTSKSHTLNITYPLINIKYQERLDVLSKLVQVINPYLCFVFVSKKENQEVVYQRLVDLGKEVVSINSNIGVKKRIKLIEDILALKYQYVVTSDLAARGLDFKISHVIHYDLPHFLEFFQHRSGRTGRMYESGMVITFLSVDDHRKIDKLKKQGIPFVDYVLTDESLEKQVRKKREVSEEEINALKKLKTKKKVKPNYKKKHAEEVRKTRQAIRRKEHAAKNR